MVSLMRKQAKANIPPPTASLVGKTVVITGATGGICSHVAREMAELGASTIILGVRNRAKGERTATTLVEGLETKPDVQLWDLDLSSLPSVLAFAERVARLPRLDVMLLGAATITDRTVITGDGWEQSEEISHFQETDGVTVTSDRFSSCAALQVTHISNALITALIMPTMIRSGEISDSIGVLANITSLSVYAGGWFLGLPSATSTSKTPLLDRANIIKPLQHGSQYAKVKLIHLYWLRALSRHLCHPRLQVHTVDPGMTMTDLARTSPVSKFLDRLGLFREMTQSARSVVIGCVPGEGRHGTYLQDGDIGV
jgi:NAD(P)-dependent dehydrogenase (short-subunit alcohol dehydrogenase family)